MTKYSCSWPSAFRKSERPPDTDPVEPWSWCRLAVPAIIGANMVSLQTTRFINLYTIHFLGPLLNYIIYNISRCQRISNHRDYLAVIANNVTKRSGVSRISAASIVDRVKCREVQVCRASAVTFTTWATCSCANRQEAAALAIPRFSFASNNCGRDNNNYEAACVSERRRLNEEE